MYSTPRISLGESIIAIPYTGLFIATYCNSRLSHGQYTRSSTLTVRISYKCKTTGKEL
jgi:hypothetical protein